jgi:Autophagy-related protein 13
MTSYAYSNWRGGNNAQASMENGPRAKCDQVIFESIAKACEIIVGSRNQHGKTLNFPSSTPATARFNLNIPEHKEIRTILQRWRRALHVPLRIDVYHQHNSQDRELLERWCLEYLPSTLQNFVQKEPNVSQDPIVQLRHVCKRIVIWLRTLYCSTRLLPCTMCRNINIGFSIYVSEGPDDILELLNQDFLVQEQPTAVTTPYGELGWKVVYAHRSVVERLMPKTSRVSFATPSMPIPIANHESHRSTSSSRDAQALSRTAPTHRPSGEFDSPNTTKNLKMPQNTYDAGRMFHRSMTTMTAEGSPSLQSVDVQRRHTTHLADHLGDKKPERVLSGLSLALLSTEEKQTTESAMEKRHAALHQVPPHLAELTHSPKARTSDYGYAYNTHIPWQKVHPSLNNPTVTSFDDPRANNSNYTGPPQNTLLPPLGSSPGVISSTPPTGAAFLGPGTTPPISIQYLIPPRNPTMTPPFTSRPAGFAEPDNLTMNMPDGPALTSLDLLHTSPFDSNYHHHQASFLSSLSNTDSILHHSAGTELRRSLWGPGYAMDMKSRSISPHPVVDEDDHDDENEMPFAVDLVSNTNPSTTASANLPLLDTSLTGTSSAAVASFAHKCALGSSQRLQLFDSVSAKLAHSTAGTLSGKETVASLVDQLAEFKSFGASLLQENNDMNEANSGSSVPPISLHG